MTRTRKVIDVSYWQRDIDWDAVVAAGVKGVIIKISEGTTPEETYWTHLDNAKKHGLSWGVYCYSHATTPKEAVAEANEVLYLLQGEQPPLGIWFDFEAPECLATDDPTAICSRFVAKCNADGYAAGIYASLSTLTDVLELNLLADYVPVWCAQYDEECNFKDDYPDKILAGWQYSDSQYIGDTNVDMNEWYAEDW